MTLRFFIYHRRRRGRRIHQSFSRDRDPRLRPCGKVFVFERHRPITELSVIQAHFLRKPAVCHAQNNHSVVNIFRNRIFEGFYDQLEINNKLGN